MDRSHMYIYAVVVIQNHVRTSIPFADSRYKTSCNNWTVSFKHDNTTILKVVKSLVQHISVQYVSYTFKEHEIKIT